MQRKEGGGRRKTGKEEKRVEISMLTYFYTPKPELSRNSQNVCLKCFEE